MRFAVTIDRDEDGVWVVECPSLPGCELAKVFESRSVVD